MVASEGLGEAFVIAGPATEPSEPAEGSLNHPALRNEYEVVFGFHVFNDLQLDRVDLGLGCCGLARVALVGIGHLDGSAVTVQ